MKTGRRGTDADKEAGEVQSPGLKPGSLLLSEERQKLIGSVTLLCLFRRVRVTPRPLCSSAVVPG